MLPSMERIRDPCKCTAGVAMTENEENYFLNWYWVHWLPAAAGASILIDDHKFYKLPTMPLKDDDSKKAAVTKESEAFGILVCQNCYKKWQYLIPAKHQDPDFKAPAYDKDNADTHKWHSTEWTVATNGQKEGEGWSPAAYIMLSELIKQVKDRRLAEKRAKWRNHLACLAYVQSQNGIEEGAREPNKKKAKKGGSPKAVYQAVEELSDVDYEEGDED